MCILIYLMFITKELAVYCIKKKKNYFLLYISISQGWGLTKINSKLFMPKFKFSFFSKVHTCFFFNVFLGFFRNYFYFLKLRGMGFKFLYHSLGIILKLGFSHRVFLVRQLEISFLYLSRRSFRLEGRSLTIIKDSLFRFMRLKTKSVYKKKGIFLKGSVLRLKITSKKSKF
jgi:ribosomal protein L6P/L9E